MAFSDCPYGLYLPNIFTPNGDLINDIFYASGYGVSSMELRIFNRLQCEVFYTAHLHNGWDGSFQAQPCPEGVYMYTLIYTLRNGMTKINKQGTITLLR